MGLGRDLPVRIEHHSSALELFRRTRIGHAVRRRSWLFGRWGRTSGLSDRICVRRQPAHKQDSGPRQARAPTSARGSIREQRRRHSFVRASAADIRRPLAVMRHSRLVVSSRSRQLASADRHHFGPTRHRNKKSTSGCCRRSFSPRGKPSGTRVALRAPRERRDPRSRFRAGRAASDLGSFPGLLATLDQVSLRA